MKKFLGVIFISFLFVNSSYADQILLACQIEDKSEDPYFLHVDLGNKSIDRVGNLYKIISISDTQIAAERKLQVGKKHYHTTIFLDRYYGDMIFITNSKNSTNDPWENVDNVKFECNNYPVF